MNKSELIDLIAREADVTKAAAGRVLEATLEGIVGAVAKGEAVTLTGFGSFAPSKRAARTGRNPKTGATLEIAESVVPKFSAGATFKKAVSEAYEQ